MQRSPGTAADRSDIALAARREAAAVARAMAAAHITAIVAEDADEALPDAVFPNNWLSFHEDGSLVLYPLLAQLRRRERREAVIEAACRRSGFKVQRRIDFTAHEDRSRFLEGTGSLVLDRRARVAYACRSPRTDAGLAAEWARALGYELCCFSAVDAQGVAYYHTNVMMWIGARCAAVCLESVTATEQAMVRAQLERSGRALLELSRAEVTAFCGNMLELTVRRPAGAGSLLVMSATAAAALTSHNAAAIRRHVDETLIVSIPTIESVGGGSIRCMIAEIPPTGSMNGVRG